MTALAPIVLFVYARPWHTEQTLIALKANKLADRSVLYIYSDGPKNDSVELTENIRKTREIIRSEQWCGEVVIREFDQNRGLAVSILAGVTEVVNQHGHVIVLEDDIVTSPGFLKYMNDALELWKDDERVMHISGYMYPLNRIVSDETVFLKVLSCWGWATWKRAWRFYNDDTGDFMKQLADQSSIDDFNAGGAADFYDQLKQNHEGKMKTWAVKWYASWYFRNGITLFPKSTLTRNIGQDGSGEHSGVTNSYNSSELASAVNVRPGSVQEDLRYRQLINKFYRNERKRVTPKPPFFLAVKLAIYRLGKRILNR